jgi:hypothetical protein
VSHISTLFVQYAQPLSALGAAIFFVWGAFVFIREYRLKTRAEVRLKELAQVEMEVKLLTLFTELMSIAEQRKSYHVSEKAIEVLLERESSSPTQELSQDRIQELLSAALIVLPVGNAAQDAAIAAIGGLGERHAFLRGVAVRSLEAIMIFKPGSAKPLLDRLRAL